MKTIGANLTTHLASTTTTLAMCWKLTRKDGTVLGFTSHHEDLEVSGVTYQSAVGFRPSSVDTQAGLNVDNLAVQGFLNSLGLTGDDVRAGLYDGGTIEVFLVNYSNLTHGITKLRRGFLGDAKFGRQKFEVEVRGLLERYQREICELYTPSCRADLGDDRCTVDLAAFTATGTVGAVTSKRVFTSGVGGADDYYKGGLLTWTSGLNDGLAMEVKSWIGGEFELMLAMPYTVTIGDGFSVYAGCDKRIATCKDTFNNVVNFRGEPYVPQTQSESIVALR